MSNAQHNIVELALLCQERLNEIGFYIDVEFVYPGKLCLFATESDSIFAKGMVLETFNTYQEALAFYAGWEKCRMATPTRKTK